MTLTIFVIPVCPSYTCSCLTLFIQAFWPPNSHCWLANTHTYLHSHIRRIRIIRDYWNNHPLT